MIRRGAGRWIAAAAAVAALVGGIAFWRCLPDPLFTSPVSAVLFDRDGALLGAKTAVDGQWRFPRADHVADKYVAALVAYEDKRFFRHPGVDPIALARAVYLNLRHRDIVSGGSTITMQVIRLARANPDRTYAEKLVEMLWALRLELGTRKAEILSLYAANAPFGGNVVGLEAAAWRYFGRRPEDLTWAEAAMLAVLPNSPSLIHLARNRTALREKRDGLLRRLHDRGRMDETELELALLEPVPEAPHALPQEAPHLLETLAAGEAHGDSRFVSTLDRSLQRTVQRIAARNRHALVSMGIENLAVVVIDNRRFEVLAYVGNSDWAVSGNAGHAIDLMHRPRSTGSILKPLLYARMLDAGEIVPQTLVPDLPTQFGAFMPENYDKTYRGAVPARLALARSLNVPAVRMLYRYGVDGFYDFLVGAGMTTLHRRPQDYGLTLILGGAEGTLWDLSGMYANLAYLARRRSASPTTYRQPVVLRDAATVTTRTAEISTGAAWLTLEALVEVQRPGLEGNWRAFADAERIAWKTGTSYGHRDGWAIGSSSAYTVGVWVGNATGEGRPDLTGVGAAAPLLFDVFNVLPPAPSVPRPDFALREVEVCRDDGYLAVGGCSTETALTPLDSHFEQPSPHHRLVHLDRSGAWRVDGSCESVGDMTHVTWFALPPGQEYYYRRFHSEYRSLPPYRRDCVRLAAEEVYHPIAFLYPSDGASVYIPTELSGERGRVVFEATHRDPSATLFWHLDDRFLGTTETFHEQAIDVAAGRHMVTVVDQDGNRASRVFEVLGRGGR